MTTEETMTEPLAQALAAGVLGLGVIAVIVGIILLVATVKFAMSGMTPAAMICGFALIALVSPYWGIIGAILTLIILALKGNPYMGFQAVLGWLVGMIILVISIVAATALGMAVAA